MKDIAAECGVSVATVSKALNNYSDIGKETRDRINAVAERMGYFPNSSARALKTKRTYHLGVLFTDMANLDDLNRQEMNTEKVVALSGTLYTLLDSLMALCPSVNPEAEIRRAGLLAPDSPLLPMHVMTEEEAGELLRRLPFLQQGLPRMVLRLTLGTETLYKTSEDSEEGGADPDAE